MSGAWIALVLADTVLLLAVAVVLLGLLRRTTVALEAAGAQLAALKPPSAVGGLAEGARAPSLRLDTGRGVLDVRDLLGAPVLYLLSSEECAPCRALADELRSAPPIAGATVVVVTDPGTAVDRYPVEVLVAYQRHGEISTAFASNGTPHAVLVDEAGAIVANAVPRTVADLRQLVRAHLHRQGSPAAAAGELLLSSGTDVPA